MPADGHGLRKLLSFRDGIALIAAVGLGVSFAYLSGLAGFTWLIVAAPFAILVVPCVVIFLADQRKLLVWQVCVLSFPIYIRAKMGGMKRMDTLKMMFVFWALGTICSAPAPIYFYLRRLKGRMRYLAAGAIAVLVVVILLLVKRVTG